MLRFNCICVSVSSVSFHIIGGYMRAPSIQGGVMQHANQAHEISIPNDLIGCIIGRGGSKINEIR